MKHHRLAFLFPLMISVAALAPPVHADDWPQFRGPARDGISREAGLPAEWPEAGPAAVWRKPVGAGWGSFAVADGRAWTLEQQGANECVVCYSVADGRELWRHSYPGRFFEVTGGGEGPRSTPTLDEGRIYALGAEGELSCLDAATGERIWAVAILKEHGMGNLTWGLAASPLVADGRVYVTASGSERKPGLFAFDKLTGVLAYKTQNMKHGYASPVMAELAGHRQMLSFSAGAVSGIDPNDGALLWSVEWPISNDVNASQPIPVGGDRVFISSGWGKGCAVIKIEAGDAMPTADIVWKNLNMKNKFGSSILLEGLIYGLDEGIMSCLDTESGKRLWKGGRYGLGQMIHAGGNFIILSEEGDLVLVRASREGMKESARVHVFDSTTWNVPALSDGMLLIRNDREMVCYDLRPKERK